MAKRKKKLRIGNLFISIVVVMISGYFIYIAMQDILLNIDLTAKVNNSKKQIEQLEAENQQLVNQKTKLQDPEYVKSYARGAYMMSKNGEQIFHISGDD